MTSQTPDQIAAAWAQRLGSSTAKITAGVQAVTVAPGQAAARQKAVYLQNTQAAVDKWASRTAAVPLATWQAAVTDKGIPRIATGATAAQPKFASFMGQLLPFVQGAVAGLPPRGNLDQNIARMTAFSRKMATFKQSGQ